MKDFDLFDTDEEDFDTVMASDIDFKGTISFEKPFFIKGRVNGNIDSQSDLLVDTDAEVRAAITADRVYVRGKIFGNIEAKRLIYVTSTGTIQGDISAEHIVLEHGSSFSGKCTTTGMLAGGEEPL